MHQRASAAAATALLLMMFVLAGGAALRESVTIDEVAHIGAGLSYVQKLDLRYNDEHPPLVKVLAGLPLAIRGTRADYSSEEWRISDSLFRAFLGEWVFGDWVLSHWNDARSTLMWARFPMLLLTLLLGWVIFAVGRRIGGDWGGLLCLAAYVTTPAFLTFGPLVLTDLGIALFALLTVWRLGDLWRNPDRANIRWFALALAGALLTKFSSGILLIAVWVYVLSTRRWRLAGQPVDKVEARAWRKFRWRALRSAVAQAATMVYVVYFVLSWNQPVDIPGLAGHGWLSSLVGRPLMPPWLFLRGLGFMLITSIRPSFILGHMYPHGVWFYFPVLLVLKSLPGFLGLLAMTLALAFHWRARSRGVPVIPPELASHWRAIWVSMLVFTGVCLVSAMDISIRHFTVPLVLLTLLMAPLPRLIEGSAKSLVRPAAAVAVVLIAICLIAAVRVYPYYMQYASPLGMGRPLYWLMSDSNVDWNQGLLEVEQFARQHRLTDVPIDAYGFSDAGAFVPHWRMWDCQVPADSDAGHWAFVSANLILDSGNCIWILRYPHETLAGGGMYAVRLPSPIPTPGSAGGPPAPGERRAFLNAPMDMRPVFRDICNHPDRIAVTLDQMVAKYREAQEAASGKKPAN